MSKDLLTKEELEDLLSSPPASEKSSHVPPHPSSERSSDHTEITLRYWQQTVLQMQRELAELRERVDALENNPKGKTPASKNKTPAAIQQGKNSTPGGQTDVKPDPTPSRKEKFKSGRGKWF
jgi:hypothetical protein